MGQQGHTVDVCVNMHSRYSVFMIRQHDIQTDEWSDRHRCHFVIVTKYRRPNDHRLHTYANDSGGDMTSERASPYDIFP